MAARLIENLATTPQYAAIFADEPLLQAMLDFEAALARAEASVGVIPSTAAETISNAARAGDFDAEQLAEQGLRAGTLAIPLVKALTNHVRAADPSSARFVHWGATSQDVSDTAMVLLLRRAWSLLEADHARLQKSLRRASDQHADTVMLGRTLLQPAPPITFGLKIAGWFGAIRRGWTRLDAAFRDAMVLEFGGASGTLAALGDRAVPVAQALAKELDLALPEAPWHTQRDRLAAVVCACGIYTGSVAKMAKDVSLLMQGEVGEAFEPVGDERGGSSTMPHKRNPIACSLALAAGERIPGLAASYLFGMAQEHERAVGGWHAESATIAQVIQNTGLAASSMAEAAAGLEVDAPRMRENIEKTCGVIFAERAMILLGASLGRDVAYKLLEDAVKQSMQEKKKLTEVLAAIPQVTNILSTSQIQSLDDPKNYLGAAEVFRRRLLITDD
ncbi:MAG: 3-carboxy-cis,cis-muconate cycloisomerase [Candidatus Acidiferrales bacterium]|jgi:3-carboxy-cis,cis-muconate cycloisomerase